MHDIIDQGRSLRVSLGKVPSIDAPYRKNARRMLFTTHESNIGVEAELKATLFSY